MNIDKTASGYLNDSFEGIERMFTDVTILSTSEVNVVAKAKRYGRWWLLKGLQKGKTLEASYQQRLRKELELMMQLQHQYVVSAVGMDHVEGLGECIVMEYVDGMTLKEWLDTSPSLTRKRRIAKQLIEAVGYFHSKGIVHRDLKPSNIIITRNGEYLKLIDFGLADSDSYAILKQPAGTPDYMSPEQKNTAVADVRNDIYSLGVIFCEMRIGYSYIINRCKLPIAHRYQNIEELKKDFEGKSTPKKRYILFGIVLLLVLVAGIVSHHYTDDSEQRHVDEAIERGKVFVDNRMDETGISQHLDTLSSLKYYNPVFHERLNDGMVAIEDYTDQIKSDFTEEELVRIREVLTSHQNERQLDWVNKFNTMKEAYDESAM